MNPSGAARTIYNGVSNAEFAPAEPGQRPTELVFVGELRRLKGVDVLIEAMRRGSAQINGWRGEANSQEKIRQRVEHELYYIENWSILLDLCILAMTPLALAGIETAY